MPVFQGMTQTFWDTLWQSILDADIFIIKLYIYADFPI